MKPTQLTTDKVMKEWKEIRKLGPDDQTMGQFYDKIEAFLSSSLSQATTEAREEMLVKLNNSLRKHKCNIRLGTKDQSAINTVIKTVKAEARGEIERVWAMPSRWTFTIKPIKRLLEQEKILGLYKQGKWIDPFAGYNSPADLTNDKDPKAPTDFHLDALEFLKQQKGKFDGCLYDPPYSFRQAKKYGSTGFNRQDYWAKIKDEIVRLIKPGGKVISFGWNSNGVGKSRGFEIKRIMLVVHGGSRNDTIVTVELASLNKLSSKGRKA